MQTDEPTTPPDVHYKRTVESDFFGDRTCVEVARCSWDRPVRQNYLQGCRWSPDGTCVLTAVNNDGMHIVEMPTDLYRAETVSEDRPVDILTSAVHVKEGGLVYDYAWYPRMNSGYPETCCWIASRQHEPIQMWDAFTGALRCSYKGYDQYDEVEAALSLAFSPVDGSTIYGGYKKSLKSFDVNIPGRETASWRTKSTASCMAIASSMPDTIIFGSWNRSISVLDTRSGEILSVGNYTPANSHTAGVTWLGFAPDTEDQFASGARKDPKVLLWDVRKLTVPVRTLYRTCATNQRIYLDFSTQGHWLASGDTDGTLHAWNLRDAENDRSKELQFPLHRDCLNGVSFHPHAPVLATTSGQYHFSRPAGDDEDDQVVGCEASIPADNQKRENYVENSLTLWWIGKAVLSEE
ncbi:telomerase Cajal body protein 1 homolog [Anopheles cruzii]|uniref:telomerase Cajal body protein 1 homolog n=1 Tax=Anopheles cruzii TaxID=68878 RepID=UPI0022EC384B|nr:telomerase Cajal body protein 1 homolog [Anopheles cruzii]